MTVDDLREEYRQLGAMPWYYYPWLEEQLVEARNKVTLHEATIKAMREEIQELMKRLEAC